MIKSIKTILSKSKERKEVEEIAEKAQLEAVIDFYEKKLKKLKDELDKCKRDIEKRLELEFYFKLKEEVAKIEKRIINNMIYELKVIEYIKNVDSNCNIIQNTNRINDGLDLIVESNERIYLIISTTDINMINIKENYDKFFENCLHYEYLNKDKFKNKEKSFWIFSPFEKNELNKEIIDLLFENKENFNLIVLKE